MTDANPPSPPTPPTPSPQRIPVGAHVTSRHAPEWGKGIVTGNEGKLVRVLFVAHPSRKQVVVPGPSLVVERVGNWPDPSKVLAASSSPAPKSKAAAKSPKVDPPPEPAPEPKPE